jgi:carbon monoxide dehydrogenase subunit G
MMIHNQRTREVDATPQDVWAVMGRFMHMQEFAPRIQTIDALTESEDGVGARRRCNFEGGGSVVEEVTEWEDNWKYTVRMSEAGTMPLKDAYVELSVEPIAEGRSQGKMAMDYQMKFGPIGWLMGQTMMKRMMGGIFEEILNELGKKVEKDKVDRVAE